MSSDWIRFIFDCVVLSCLVSMPVMQIMTLHYVKENYNRGRRIEALMAAWTRFYGVKESGGVG